MATSVRTTTASDTLRPSRQGKVRDIYDLGSQLLIAATDRISAFDVVLPDGIPNKGAVLTQISAFWFQRLADLVPSHVLSTNVNEFPEPFRSTPAVFALRSMLVRKIWVHEDPEARWARFIERYAREMNQPDNRHAIQLLAEIAKRTPLSIGCFCSDESHCHRSILRKLIQPPAGSQQD